MQNDHVLKKLNFDLTSASGEGVYVQKICYHVDACVIPFNLICNMTIFSCLICFISTVPLSSYEISVKKY